MDETQAPHFLAEEDLLALIKVIEDEEQDELQRFLNYAEQLEVEPDDVIIQEGGRDRDVYMLTDGELEVRVAAEPDGSDLVIATVTPFAILGEQSFLDEGARTATIAATAPSTVHRLSPDGFETLCDEAPDLAIAFLFDVARSLSLRDRVNRA